MLALDALGYVTKLKGVKTVLDVGPGLGLHKQFLEAIDKEVKTVDTNLQYNPDYLGDFVTTEVGGNYDLVWASHVLEHQPNVNSFIKKCNAILKDGGYLAVTVPPAKMQIVGGHLTLWNAGLLLYNLILGGFNCDRAAVKTYGYNISVVVQKKPFTLPELRYDNGDIETLSGFFPFPAQQDFNGCIDELNWKI